MKINTSRAFSKNDLASSSYPEINKNSANISKFLAILLIAYCLPT